MIDGVIIVITTAGPPKFKVFSKKLHESRIVIARCNSFR